VEGVAAGADGRVHEALGVEVRPGIFAERPGFVRAAHVEGFAIDLGVDRNRGDSELARRSRDANRDLSAVGDEELLEHRRRL
jgi:hypothetical protein